MNVKPIVWRVLAVVALLFAAALVSGCSSFRLGGMAYCPYGASCTFQMIQIVPVAAPAPAASATSVSLKT